MTGDLPREQLISKGRETLDWIADYLEHPEKYPVLSKSKPGEIAASLPTSPPDDPESLDAIFADFEAKIIPGITHWNNPAFFGYFATSSSVPGILAEMLVATLDVKAMLWKTSPAATELEQVVMDWLRQMLGLGADGSASRPTPHRSRRCWRWPPRVKRVQSFRCANAAWRAAPIYRGCASTVRRTHTRRSIRRCSRSGSASRTS
jgi:hypothetical protein